MECQSGRLGQSQLNVPPTTCSPSSRDMFTCVHRTDFIVYIVAVHWFPIHSFVPVYWFSSLLSIIFLFIFSNKYCFSFLFFFFLQFSNKFCSVLLYQYITFLYIFFSGKKRRNSLYKQKYNLSIKYKFDLW